MLDLEKVLRFYDINISSTKEKILCPFHADKNASLLIDVEGNWWKCFGCEKHGDAFKFHEEYQRKLGSVNGLRILKMYNAIIVGSNTRTDEKLVRVIEEKKDNKYFLQKLTEAKDYYYGLSKVKWTEEDSEVSEYMKWRGFDLEMLNTMKAKYSYNMSYPIMFPLLDNKKFKGYVGRTTDLEVAEGGRKYLYNKGFRRRYTLAGDYNSSTVMIVEGYMDMMKAKQLGIKNVVAILGWKITKMQVEKLKDMGVKVVISALDNDKCGRDGTRELKQHFKVIRFPYPMNVHDMGDMTVKKFKICKKKVNNMLKQMESGGN
jgi:DNA primase